MSPFHDTDEERFRRLFAEHYDDVWRFATRWADAADVDDVVAEAFVVAWRRLDDVPATPRAWLLGVTRRVAANRRRGTRRRQALADRAASTYSAPVHEPAALTSPVLAAFAQLSRRDQQVLALVSWDGLSASDAAAVVDCTPATFRVRLHRARRRLEAQLHQDEPTRDDLEQPRWMT